MNDLIKKLSGKNKTDYEQVAKEMIDNADVALFKELVANDDFLFDFVKQNVAERLANACNETNYKNLLKFFVCYSPYYDDFIISTLAKYADEDLTDEIQMMKKPIAQSIFSIFRILLRLNFYGRIPTRTMKASMQTAPLH